MSWETNTFYINMMIKPRNLVVENSMPVATVLRERLVRELDVDVVHAASHAEAVTCIQSAGTEFFLAILDLALPDAEHGEIVDYALAHNIPSMVYTSHIDPELRQRLLEKSVSDQGPGVPEDQQHRLFKYFSKIDSRPAAGKQGTGLGLAIVRKIVETHRGRVWVENRPDSGARFHFSLPGLPVEENGLPA